MRYPAECPVFACDKFGPHWDPCVGVGPNEDSPTVGLDVLSIDDPSPLQIGLILKCELRPLTRAARAMLALAKR